MGGIGSSSSWTEMASVGGSVGSANVSNGNLYFQNGTYVYKLSDFETNHRFDALLNVSDDGNFSVRGDTHMSGNLTVGLNTLSANAYTGNVGIGTTSTSYKLDVNGTLRAGNIYPGGNTTDYWGWDSTGITKYGVGYTFISQGTFYVQSTIVARGGITNDSANALTIAGGNTGITYFSGAGNVGIGTSTPGYKLDVNGTFEAGGNISSAGTFGAFVSETGGNFSPGTATTGALYLAGSGGTNYGIYQYGGGYNYLSGSLAIGITTPSTALDVDTASNTLGLRLRGTAETTEIGDIFVGSAGNLVLTTRNTGATAAYVEIDPEDNDYGLILRDGNTGSSIYANMYVTDTTVDYLNINVNATSSTIGLVVDDADNVGIGTATPGYKFDVNGPGRFVTSLNSSWLGAVMTTNTSANAVGLMSGQVNGTNWTGVAGKSSASNGAGVFGEASHASGYGIYCNSTTNTNGCGGNRAWFNASDSRLKKDIVTIPNALDTVMHLRGVNFNWIEGGQADTGFIAQEVLPYLPQAVGQDSVTGYYGMKTGSLTGLLVEAVKAQQNQMLALTLQGDINLSPLDENLQTPALKYIPVTTSGENVSTVGTFFKATIANLKAGFISAKDISVDSMTIAGQSLRDYIASVVESLPGNNTGLVQPIVDADIVTTNTLSADLIQPTTSTSSGITIALNNNSNQEISIKDENDNTVSSLDGKGNAEFTGTVNTSTISAKFAYLDTIEANTINAKTIRANQIEGMQAILDRIYGASISAQQYSVSELRPQDMPEATESALLAEFGTWSASPSATFSTQSIIAETGYFSDYMEVGSHLLIGDVSTNQNMIIDGSSLMTSNDTLFIQPSGVGVINVLAGALVIRDTGDIDIRGNVFIAGNLDVKGDTTLFGTLDLAPNPDATGSSKLASLINITDEFGNTVATIDASGSATFKDTTLQKLIIAAPAPVATGSGTTQTTQNNASAGSGTIIAGETEVIIPNTGVTPHTLIYLTPQSDTQNQVLYVKNKTVDQGFTVSMNTPLTSNVTFTYWLIETKE